MARARGFEPTPRDVEILSAIALYRMLTVEQVNRLFFPPTETRNKQGELVVPARQASGVVSAQAKIRVRKLFDEKYLARTSQLAPTFVYWLDRLGADYLSAYRDLPQEALSYAASERHVSAIWLKHALTINDVRITVEQAAARQGITLAEWRDERSLKRTHRGDKLTILIDNQRIETTVQPDSYFVLEANARPFSHFLEVDLKTETGKAATNRLRQDSTWERKILAYLVYYQRPGGMPSLYEKRYGTAKGRVLTITIGEGRLANLKRITEEAGGRERFWFTTFARVEQADILTAPIWSVAAVPERKPLIF